MRDHHPASAWPARQVVSTAGREFGPPEKPAAPAALAVREFARFRLAEPPSGQSPEVPLPTTDHRRNRVRVFPDPKTGLFQIEWRENGRRLTRSLGHRDR